MLTHKRYCKRILKQYGNNIKKWEERIDNPLTDKRNTEFSENLLNRKGEGVFYDRRFEVSWYLKRGSKNITCYDDLVRCANE